MAKKKAKKKTSQKKEKTVEIFEVENKKTGEEKQIVKKTIPKEEHSTKEEKKKQEKQLKSILITLGIIVLTIVIIMSGLSMVRHSSYENTKFNTVQEGDLIFYQTSIPVLYKGSIVPYNFYIRTHPRELKKVPFEGELELKKGYLLNVTKEFDCEGDGIIALANLVKQREAMGIILIEDENAGCDELSRYNYYEIKEGDETKIIQRGNMSCYDIYVNNCEILKATEKLMAETFVKFNEE